jgi:hypothetical protein
MPTQLTTQHKQFGIFSLPVIVAALGYFVDIYDLLLFTIVREPSLKGIGVELTDKIAVLAASTKIINWQMIGLLIGGVLWGTIGDKKEDSVFYSDQLPCIQLPTFLQDMYKLLINMQLQDLLQELDWQVNWVLELL